MSHVLRQLAVEWAQGRPKGIYSVCSAHHWALEAAFDQALEDGSHLLIEATSNQVNHRGGYTGMLPEDFRRRVIDIAARKGFDESKLILGGEVCMWAEQLNSETLDSRVWPRTMAVAERFWSPQSDRDISDMYRRLRINSLKLEDVALQHISGPEMLRRDLLRERHPEALDVLASVLEPVSFHERYGGQHTNGLTTLNRLVDAVVADPSSRQEIAGDVDALTAGITVPPPSNPKLQLDLSGDVRSGVSPSPEVALGRLRHRFLSWQAAEPQLLEDVRGTPRLVDAAIRAEQLGELARVGLSALNYLQTHTTPPAGWQAQQISTLDTAEQPSALVRFTFLHSMRKLVLAAAQTGRTTAP